MYLSGLNNKQIEAVKETESYLRVIAGIVNTKSNITGGAENVRACRY